MRSILFVLSLFIGGLLMALSWGSDRVATSAGVQNPIRQMHNTVSGSAAR